MALADGESSITGARTKDGKSREAERGLYAIIAVKTSNGWMIRALREQSSATTLSVGSFALREPSSAQPGSLLAPPDVRP